MTTMGGFSCHLLRTTGGSFGNRFDGRLPAIALVSYVIALFAWVMIMSRWLPMVRVSMEMPLSDPGAPEAMALSNGLAGIALYLLMWSVMMIAMMYPSSVPLFRMYAKTLEGMSQAGKAARLGAFMGTYALVWTVVGIVPLVVNAVVPLSVVASTYDGVLVGGSLLLLAGYQHSSLKDRCLRKCRSPLGFLIGHHRPGVRGAIRMGVKHSVFCVGCCWALFAFMVVVGSMNILWMGVIAVVLSLERTSAWVERFARASGVLAGIVGIATIALPLLRMTGAL